jgi:hypothetical protein
MRTHTLPSPDLTDTTETVTPAFIEKTVNERGFYLYEWITPDELRMTIDRDYLQIVQRASIPLAIVTAIAGFIGFAWGVLGVIFAGILVLGVFYTIVFLILLARAMHRAYLYTRWANVVITDEHFVSGSSIFKKDSVQEIQKKFQPMEEIFDEKFLWESRLAERKKHEQKNLLNNLKEIMSGWWRLIQNIAKSRSRDTMGVIVVFMIIGILYGLVMMLVYFFGLFLIYILGRVFSIITHKYLLSANNTEYTIQNLFHGIAKDSIALKSEKEQTLRFLQDAQENQWKENLSKKIDDSFRDINTSILRATEKNQELKNLLNNSQYKNIFNFKKYETWIRVQILEPIESLLLLLQKNHDIIEWTIHTLDIQIANTHETSLKNPLELQKTRLMLQKENFASMIKMINGYREKLV